MNEHRQQDEITKEDVDKLINELDLLISDDENKSKRD